MSSHAPFCSRLLPQSSDDVPYSVIAAQRLNATKYYPSYTFSLETDVHLLREAQKNGIHRTDPTLQVHAFRIIRQALIASKMLLLREFCSLHGTELLHEYHPSDIQLQHRFVDLVQNPTPLGSWTPQSAQVSSLLRTRGSYIHDVQQQLKNLNAQIHLFTPSTPKLNTLTAPSPNPALTPNSVLYTRIAKINASIPCKRSTRRPDLDRSFSMKLPRSVKKKLRRDPLPKRSAKKCLSYAENDDSMDEAVVEPLSARVALPFRTNFHTASPPNTSCATPVAIPSSTAASPRVSLSPFGAMHLNGTADVQNNSPHPGSPGSPGSSYPLEVGQVEEAIRSFAKTRIRTTPIAIPSAKIPTQSFGHTSCGETIEPPTELSAEGRNHFLEDEPVPILLHERGTQFQILLSQVASNQEALAERARKLEGEVERIGRMLLEMKGEMRNADKMWHAGIPRRQEAASPKDIHNELVERLQKVEAQCTTHVSRDRLPDKVQEESKVREQINPAYFEDSEDESMLDREEAMKIINRDSDPPHLEWITGGEQSSTTKPVEADKQTIQPEEKQTIQPEEKQTIQPEEKHDSKTSIFSSLSSVADSFLNHFKFLKTPQT